MFTVSVQRVKHVDLAKIAAQLHGPKQVKAGFPKSEASASNIEKAIWNEFGTRGGASGGGWGGPIPERPFMRNAIRNNTSAYRSAMKTSASKILRGETAIRTVLSKLGIKAQGDIQGEITAFTTPANSQVTIDLKGSSHPLIDTGSMRGAVTWKIDE